VYTRWVHGSVVARQARLLLLALALVAAAGALASALADPVAALSLMSPKPVKPAKDFQVTTPDNQPLSLTNFKGKVVFLNFWATWCKPCEAEMPGMERLHRRYRDRGLVVLAISEDAGGAGAVSPFVRKHQLTFPIGLDPKMAVASLYGVWTLPSTFIIDRQGNRAFYANGAREWDGAAAHSLFDTLLR